MNKFALFLVGCIGARLLLTCIAKKIDTKYLPYIGYITLIMGIGFIFIYMNDLRDFNTAIQEYRKVIENYSGSEQEPHALFMIGYVYANILNDIKSAKIEYEQFLNRFPKHELSPSVKFEIDYLGKSVDEIPALKHITS